VGVVTELSEAPPDQGWYPDPAQRYDHRYWHDGGWTTWVSVEGRATEEPLPERHAVAPIVALPPRSLWWGIGGFVVTIMVAAAAAIVPESLFVSLAVSTAVLYTGLLTTVWLVIRRYGSGSVVDDLGLRFRKADLAGGLATSIAARALAATATIVVLALAQDQSDRTNVQFDVFEDSDAALYLALLIAVIGAPIVEEIYFRGLLQGAFTNWVGVPAGIGAQGLLFAATHYQVDATGLENATILCATLAAGVVLGIAYQMTRRLGTSIVGHSLFNLLPAIVILASH